MIMLDNINRSLQVVLGGAITTNQLPIVACYADIVQAGPSIQALSTNTIASNSAVAVTAVAAPGAGVTRQLKYLSIQNADTVAATVTVELNDNATLRVIVKCTLQINETLSFDADNGWQTITSAGAQKLAASAAGATYASGSLSPTAPNSTANFTMQGMAGTITPKTTGNILVTISGTFVSSATTVDVGIIAQASYGTSTAPTSNAALTGTQIGAVVQWTEPIAATAAADIHVPFTLVGLISNAVIGTALWLDVAAKAVTTISIYSISNAVITAVEI